MGIFSLFSSSSSGRYRHMHHRGSDYYHRRHRSSFGLLGSIISSLISRRSRWSSSGHCHRRHRHHFTSWS